MFASSTSASAAASRIHLANILGRPVLMQKSEAAVFQRGLRHLGSVPGTLFRSYLPV